MEALPSECRERKLACIPFIVGLTYDLKERYLADGYSMEEVAELDSPETIDAIDSALRSCGYETVRIGNVKDLVHALSMGKRWDIVFNIAEGMHGLCREAQIPALLDAYRIPYVFSDSMTLVVTLHKGLAKQVVRSHSVPTADYVVITHIEQLAEVELQFPLFIKPVGGGTGIGIDGDSMVTTAEALHDGVLRLLKNHDQPVLVETYLSGREFTVGVLGTGKGSRSIGVMEIVVDNTSDRGIYSYHTKKHYLESTTYRQVEGELAAACEKVALGAWRALDCRDGGRVDVRMDELGNVNFLEVNPLAGLHPIDSDLPILASMHGLDYRDLIRMIMEFACDRLGLEYGKIHSAIA
jgi:D-alanine-D-alanine ligase